MSGVEPHSSGLGSVWYVHCATVIATKTQSVDLPTALEMNNTYYLEDIMTNPFKLDSKYLFKILMFTYRLAQM